MLDLSHVPTAGIADIQTFYGRNTAVTQPLTDMWVKPRGTSMIKIFMLGCGGNGVTATAGATSAGGAGGGSGSQASLIIAAQDVPDVLYVGGGLQGAGTVLTTMVALKAYGATYNSAPIAADLLLAAPGAIGNAVTAGGAGAASGCLLSGLGIASFLVGLAGGTAGANTATAGGAATASTAGQLAQGGGGGGGMSAAAAAAGGVCTSTFTSFAPNTAAGAAGTSGVAGGNGSHGLWMPQRLRVSTGGGGGGAGFPTATTSAGGPGGNGGYGSGGGGGGGTITALTPGPGGKGGAGIVIIVSW